MVSAIEKEMDKLANPSKAKFLSGFFKTAKGQYAEGDIFLGIVVPEQRTVAKKYWQMDVNEVIKLLHSKYHEHRMVALFILIMKYNKGDEKIRDELVKIYLSNTSFINNWDLVDLSAPNILGEFFYGKTGTEKEVLYKFAYSKDLWKKRISMLATFGFIKREDYSDALNIAEILLKDEHDLIHKAVGWMLREIGKRDLAVEEKFLKKYHKVMPRTMLRYAIEKFDEKKRKFYM